MSVVPLPKVQQEEDLFERYFKMQLNRIEPPAIFHRWAMISALSAWLGQQTWIPFGTSRILPNNYIMFVGEPGTRKSTAIKETSKLLSALNYSHFAPKKTSKEQYLADLTEPEGEEVSIVPDVFDILATDDKTPRESYVDADEFNIFMGPANMDFQDILGDMWDWDKPDVPWSYRLKNSKHVKIFQPTINILGGNTPTGFLECFPPASIGRGFLSRVLLIWGEKTGKKITIPQAPEQSLLDSVLNQFRRIKQSVIGPMSMTKDTLNAIDMIYKTWPDLEDQRFHQYSNRRFTHLLKLMMIQAAARCSTEICLLDVIKANTILAYAETQMPKAMGELGKSKSSEAANKLMQAMYSATKPLSVQDMWPIVRMDLEKMQDLLQIVNNLLQASKLQMVEMDGKKQGYLPKQKGISRQLLYVDQSILKGKELS